MAFIDYYKILGVDRNIPQKDVRAAYRKRAKLFHPDLHPNDPKAKANLFGGGRFRSSGFGAQQQQSSGQMEAKVSIDMYTALLGGEVLIQLSNGQKIKLKVKPETQNGTKVRVRGRGYSRGNGTYGDLIIVYNVKLPTGLSERQKQLLQEMRNS